MVPNNSAENVPFNVACYTREAKNLENAFNSINNINLNSTFYACDLSQSGSIKNLHNHIMNKWSGQVDSLVLNAGGPPFVDDITKITNEDWHTYFQSLFLSQIELVNYYLEYMKQQQFGRIVSITSSSIVEPLPGLTISTAIRSALSGWLKSLANEVGSCGINVTNAVIGKIDTERLMQLDQNRANRLSCSVEEVRLNTAKNIPLGRYGAPKEAAEAIVFLLSESASYINGSSIFIDGGMVKRNP